MMKVGTRTKFTRLIDGQKTSSKYSVIGVNMEELRSFLGMTALIPEASGEISTIP